MNLVSPLLLKEPPRLDQELLCQKDDFWQKRGELRALDLFRQMAVRVPAYKDFLKKNKVKAELVKTIEDYKQLPPVDKDNYLRIYPLESLCWDGEFKNKSWIVSATSGSTGKPFYFPRSYCQAERYAAYADLYLRHNFQIERKSTLYVVGFPMGAWIGGVFTLETIEWLARERGYNLSVITPGVHKLEIIKAIENLGEKYDQVILGCYGPFLKDALDDGVRLGVNWKKYHLKFVFAAEAFTEGFRDYVLRTAGISGKEIYTSTLNQYGTADLGTMSYETPLSIFARRVAVKRRRIYKRIFGDTIKLPTFTQYLPELFYFEEQLGRLYCSSASGLPMVRYDLKDRGGVFSYAQVVEAFETEKIDLESQAREQGLSEYLWSLPFVHVYERDDFSISFYAFQIYPETIRRALQRRELQRKVTGKFTMMTKYDDSQNQYIEINVEMKCSVQRSPSLQRQVQRLVVNQLLKESSEYRETYSHIGKRGFPKIILWSYEDNLFFRPGIKQKWVVKEAGKA